MDVLAEIREEGLLGPLAREGGRLISRFVELRAAFPPVRDPALGVEVQSLDEALAHHAMLLNVALDTLAVNWRSQAMRDQLHRIDGLGPPAERLQVITVRLEVSAG